MATFAETMVTNLETAIAAQQGGVVMTQIDGVTVRYDVEQAIKLRDYWQRRVAQETAGTRPRCTTLGLRNSF